MESAPIGTLGIQRARPPKRRRRLVLWLALALVGLLLGGALAVFFWGGAYLDHKARAKLQEYADRAGVELTVGRITLAPGTLAALHDVVVTDPVSGAELVRAAKIVTELSFEDLRGGKRRPSRVVIEGLALDLTHPERLIRAYKRFRGRHPTPQKAGPPTAQPELMVAGATVRVSDPITQVPVRLAEVSAHVRFGGIADPRWQIAAEGVVQATGQHLAIDARIGPSPGDGELGVTFSPAFFVPGLDGPAVSVAGLWADTSGVVRLRDLKIGTDEGLDAHAATGMIEGLKETRPLGTGGLSVRLRAVRGTYRGAAIRATEVQVRLAPGSVATPLARVREVTLEGVRAGSKSPAIAASVTRLTVQTRGLRPEAPLRHLRAVTVEGADLTAALPARATAGWMPLARALKAALGSEAAPDTPKGPASAGSSALTAAAPARSLRQQLKAWLGTARPTLSVSDSTLSLHVPGDATPSLVFVGLEAGLTFGTDKGAVSVRLRGQLEQTDSGKGGQFAVTAETTPAGRLKAARVKLSGTKLAQQAARLSDSIRLTETSNLTVDLAVTPHETGRGLALHGTVGLSDMGFLAPRIHRSAVDGLAISAQLTVDIDPKEGRVTIDAPRVQLMDGATARVVATVEHIGQPRPAIAFRIELPTQDCETALRSIPAVMVPRLRGLTLQGTLSAFLDVSVDLADPSTYKQAVDVDMRHCRPVRFGEADVGRLKSGFVHEVVEKGQPTGITVGPGTWHYRTLSHIPKAIQMGAVYTEDQSFFRHSGFRPPLIARAVRMNIKGGRYVYGGSTITQQLVKNLFLSREKTLTRKLEEAILVWLVERTLTKARILELYLNCIEYGPHIYGIENAARAYFGKHVEELDTLEGAFLMGLKPYPWAGWKQYERGYVKPWWHKRLRKILEGMRRRGWITEEQLELSRPFDPVFQTSTHARRRQAAERAAARERGRRAEERDRAAGKQANERAREGTADAPPTVSPDLDDGAPPPTPNAPIIID